MREFCEERVVFNPSIRTEININSLKNLAIKIGLISYKRRKYTKYVNFVALIMKKQKHLKLGNSILPASRMLEYQ